ncbi:MAG TPA: hypothetical protein VJY62_07050 [Bacteroidia bacterium]|nr:hypothetical protein [Bacteroidia bacterium]
MKNFLTILALLVLPVKSKSQTIQANIPTANDIVNCIVRYNDVIYIGGEFTTAGTTARNYLAAIDANSGAVLSWNPSPNDIIEKMIIAGSKLVVIGSFDTISGLPRNKICVFDLATGNLLNSNLGGWYSWTRGLCYNGNYVYYCDADTGGGFAIRRFDINTLQQDASWNSSNFGFDYVEALAVYGNYIYASGDFDIYTGSTYIDDVCRFNLSDGSLDTSFNFDIDNGDYLYEVVAHNGKIYVTGNYTQFDGFSRNGITEIDTAGFVTSKVIYCSNHINRALTLQGNTLWIGGNSSNIGGASRYCIAQVDITTGYATCWSTSVLGGNVYLTSIWAHNDTVYAAPQSGGFKAFNGNPSFAFLGSDTVLCAGGSVVISAPAGLTNYLWNTGATVSSITVNSPGNYWFSATAGSGCIVTGNRVLSACTGIEEDMSLVQIGVAPNISSGIYFIRVPGQSTRGAIEIHDLKGNLVYFSSVHPFETEIQLDISTLPAATYVCNIFWENRKSNAVKLLKY